MVASLFSLPSEIISHIISLMPKEQLPQLATVSRQCQTFVEQRTFEHITLQPWRATQAKKYLSKKMQHVRAVSLAIALPLEVDKPRNPAFYETMFRDAIHNVLPLIASQHKSAGGSSSACHLEIGASSPLAFLMSGPFNQLFPAQFIDTWMVNESHLPMMPTIQSFECTLDGEPVIYSPATIIYLTRLMPNLKQFRLLSLDAIPDSHGQTKMKEEFVQSLDQLPPHLEHVMIQYSGLDASPIPSSPAIDSEPRGLRACSSLRALTLEMSFANFLVLSGCHYAPIPDEWRCLETFNLKFNRDAGPGESYFQREEVGFIVDDEFIDSIVAETDGNNLTEINNATLEPVLSQLASLAQRMPRLRRFTFEIISKDHFELVYQPAHLLIRTHHVFEPDDAVLGAWADVYKASQPRNHNMKVTFESAGPRTRHVDIPIHA